MDFWTSSKPGRIIVGAFVVLGYFVVFGLVIWKARDVGAETVRDLLFLFSGALINQFTSVGNFFYGTTQSSASKDNTIKELSKKEPTP